MRRFIVEESISMLKHPRFRLPETGALRFFLFVYQMTGDTVAEGDLLHFRGALTAAVGSVGATGGGTHNPEIHRCAGAAPRRGKPSAPCV